MPRSTDPVPAPESPAGSVRVERIGPVTVVTIHRPEVRNAVDSATADALRDAFESFDADPDALVAILTGAGGNFCAGADLKALLQGDRRPVHDDGPGPMGPTRMNLSKPVIAAVEGYAVAGGLELAVWCDLRVAAENAIFGVFCRRFGVPLVDLGTVRLPRLIGGSRAMDMILTGRPIAGPEALTFGLANRLCAPGEALDQAIQLAGELATLPQGCMRSDRRSSMKQWGLTEAEAAVAEARLGRAVLGSGEALAGAERFSAGEGRSGAAL